MNSFVQKFFSFLIVIFPVLLITGPFIPELILGTSSIYVNYLIIKQKNYHYYKNNYSIFFALFWSYLLLNSIFSEDPFWSLRTSIFYFRYFIFSVAIYYLLEKKIVSLNKVKTCLLITLIILVLDLFFQYYSGKNILGFIARNNRYSGFFGDELVLGSFMIKIFPLFLSVLVKDYFSIKNRYFLLTIIFLIFSISLFLTGERTSAVLGILSISLFILIIIKEYKKKIMYLLIIFMLPIIIFYLNPNLKSRFIDDTLNYISSSNYDNYTNITENKSSGEEKQKLYIFSKLHHGHYISAYELFKEKPLFGNGVNSFRNKCKNYDHEYNCSTHPHNIILQILSEVGVVGIFFYIFIFLFLIRNLLIKNNSDSFKILTVGLMIYLFPFSPSGNFFNNWLNMIFYYLIGFYMFLNYSQIKNKII